MPISHVRAVETRRAAPSGSRPFTSAASCRVALSVNSGTRKPRSPAKPQHSAERGTVTVFRVGPSHREQIAERPRLHERAGWVKNGSSRTPRSGREAWQDFSRPERGKVHGAELAGRLCARNATASPSVPAQGDASVTTTSRPSSEALQRASAARRDASAAAVAERLAGVRHAAAQARDARRVDRPRSPPRRAGRGAPRPPGAAPRPEASPEQAREAAREVDDAALPRLPRESSGGEERERPPGSSMSAKRAARATAAFGWTGQSRRRRGPVHPAGPSRSDATRRSDLEPPARAIP